VNIIAVDPGLKGGIAYVDGFDFGAIPMPIAGKEYDLATIKELLISVKPDLLVLEKVGARPDQGVTSMFSFGKGYGMIQGVSAGLGIPYELVTPQAWKGKVLKGTAKDNDAQAAYCRRAFPSVSVLASSRCRVPHTGITAALCILQYAIREYDNPAQTA
jgi:crossover junction endodeoxyribonuclease RuvC